MTRQPSQPGGDASTWHRVAPDAPDPPAARRPGRAPRRPRCRQREGLERPGREHDPGRRGRRRHVRDMPEGHARQRRQQGRRGRPPPATSRSERRASADISPYDRRLPASSRPGLGLSRCYQERPARESRPRPHPPDPHARLIAAFVASPRSSGSSSSTQPTGRASRRPRRSRSRARTRRTSTASSSPSRPSSSCSSRALILFAVLRYRRTDDELPAQTHGNLVAEAAWTIVPAIIVIALFFVSIGVQNKVEASSPNPDVTVDVVGFQWQWTFGYGCPDSYATEATVQPAEDCEFALTGLGSDGPDMLVPVNETVHFRLHAADVIHSFYVPAVPVQEGRRARARQRVRRHRRAGGHVRRPMRRVLRPLACRHVLHRHGRGPGRLRRLVRGAVEDASARRRRRRAARAARHLPALPSIELSASSATGFDQTTADGAGRQADHLRVHERRPERRAQRGSIKGGQPDGTDWIGLPLADGRSEASTTSGAAARRRHIHLLLQRPPPT